MDHNLVLELEAPRFVEGKPLLIVGFRKPFTDQPDDIPAMWQRFGPYIGNIPGQVGRVAYGVCFVNRVGDLSSCESYLTGVEVSDFSGVPSELDRISLPSQRYAVFAHRDHVSALGKTIDAIGRNWLPRSGHELADTQAFFERYGEKFEPVSGTGDIEVWLPIKGRVNSL
jgi:AraC family transcriptional regulator